MTKKTVLITGCSSGFGKLAAKTFHDKGWNVIATMRSPDKETELTKLDDVLVTRLDVTDGESIERAVDEGVTRFGTIHALVNNAAHGGHGLLEQASDDSIRSMYETNVFGVINATRAVLPLMRRQKEGCIVNVTSMAGMLGLPAESLYCSTKYAVEGLSEALALECKPLNIRVRTVAPGAYLRTAFSSNADDSRLAAGDDELVVYANKLRDHFMNVVRGEGGADADPQEVIDKIYECVTADTPVHNPVGKDAQMIVGMMGGAPRQDFLNQLEQMLLPHS